jgi:FimV-like protein
MVNSLIFCVKDYYGTGCANSWEGKQVKDKNMTINSNRLTACLIIAACLFLKGLIVPSISQASNEVSKLNAVEVQGRIRVAVFLSDRPAYSISGVDEKHILLTLNNAVKGNSFVKNVPVGTLISVNENQNPVAIKFTIGLSRSYGKIDCSWSDNKKLLYIDISPLGEPVVATESGEGPAALQDVKFGFTDKGTRMVMRLNHFPSWDMELPDPSRMLMHLIDVSDALKKQKYGAVKRLTEINIRRTNNNGMEISLGAESSLNHVALFRMASEGEDRLVLDILDEPGIISEDVLELKSKAATGQANLKEVNQPAKIIDSGHTVRLKIDNDEVPIKDSLTKAATPLPSAAASVESPVESTKPEIPAKSEPPPAAVVTAPSEKPALVSDVNIDKPVKLEPKFDDALPMSAGLKKTIDGLNPEEAFQYGRIKQAMEIKDYEKGITLTDQFMKDLPNSTLTEDMLFLKGDFYYSLWKTGDNEVLGNVISSYEKAIDRYPESELVPLSYIKMAQAQSMKQGGEYMALGYLGIVLSKKNRELMPLAYLNRGKIFLRLNQSEKALADFMAIIEQYKGSEYAAEANFWIASYYHSVGLYDDAQKKLEEVQNLNPYIYIEHPEYLFLRAKNSLYLKDYDGAREYLFKAVNIGRQQEGPDMLLTRIGDTYHNQENEKQAEKFYRVVTDYYPGTEGSSIARLRLASYSSDTTALDDLGSGTGNESISELAILEKGYQMFDKAQYANVTGVIKPLIEKPVQTETRKSARSLFYNAAEKEIARLYQEGRYNDLTDFYEPIQALLADNINPDAMLSVARAFNKLHQNEEAVSAFQKIKLNDLSLQSRGAYYTGLAESYLNKGDAAASRSLLEKAGNYDLEPADKQRISRALAVLYSEENRLDDAYALCQSIIKGEKSLPDNEVVEVYILSGKILNRQKKYDEAQKILNSTPGMPDRINSNLLKSLYMELAKACYYSEEDPKAIKAYENAFNLGYGTDNNDYWDARFNLAQAYNNAGDEKKAKKLLSEISEGGDTLMQQRAQLKLGSMDLEKQLQRLPLSKETDQEDD